MMPQRSPGISIRKSSNTSLSRSPLSWRDETGDLYEDIPQNLFQNGVPDISQERFNDMLRAAGFTFNDVDWTPEDILPNMPSLTEITPEFGG
jgi:hypothetical protein